MQQQVRDMTIGREPVGVMKPVFRLKAKQVLYYHGDEAESLYRIKEGLVRITRMSAEGRIITLRHVRSGDYFGEEVLVNGSRADSAEALTDTEIELIDIRHLTSEELMEVTCSLTDQLKRQADYEYHLSAGNVKQRVARYLCELARTELASVSPEGNTIIHAKHELIAEGTASTRESVSKLMCDLRAEGLVKTRYCSVELLDMATLQEIAEGFDA